MPIMDNTINTMLTARYPISLSLGFNHRSAMFFLLFTSISVKDEFGILAYPEITGVPFGVTSSFTPVEPFNMLE